MTEVVSLGTLHAELASIRSSSHLLPATTPRMNVRMLFAIITLGVLRRQDEIGGWPEGLPAMSWRRPSMGRRTLLIGAIESLFTFPTAALIRHRDGIRRKTGTKQSAGFEPVPEVWATLR